MKYRSAITVLLNIVIVFGASAQRNRIIRVPQDRPTIQSAVNAAKVGDTVLIDHGIYFENVRITKNIVLASRYILDHDTSHISLTIIDGSKPRDPLRASVVTIRGSTDTTCNLVGFTICRGTGTYSYIPADAMNAHWIGGGGVYIINAGARIVHNTITNNVLSTRVKNNFTFGAGIASVDTSNGERPPLPPYLIIEQNRVIGNISTGQGAEAAGIEINQPGIIRGNVICENKVTSGTRGYGGGIYTMSWSDYEVRVDRNYICRNSAGIGGGILITSGFVRRGRTIVTNNIIADNNASEVGGASNVAEQSYAIFGNNTIVRNKAMSTGGGINVPFGSHAVLVNNIIWNNSVDQVSMWGTVQTANNLIEGGFPGLNNIDDDPEFLSKDSLFGLSPNSPCLGTGISMLRLADKPFQLPQRDFVDSSRSLPPGSAPDIGAIESPVRPGTASQQILDKRQSSSEAKIKLTVIYKQTALAERDPNSNEILRAGRMTVAILVDDSLRTVYQDSSSRLEFQLPPGENLIELEVMGRARNTTQGIIVYFWLDGSDPHVSELPRQWQSVYHYYSDLRPGSYNLVLQPQDEERFIGHTNRLTIGIFVLPYWYQRWWAYVLYGFGVITFFAGLSIVRINRIRLKQEVILNQLEARKLAEMDRLKSRFFANLSHEFRTPISLILGPADQLESTESDPSRRARLGFIRRNSERLLKMVNLLLQFARIESGTIKLRVSLQPIPTLLRRIVSSFSTFALKKGLALQTTITPPSFEGYVDTEKVEHIVENLLSNAIKYTNTGGRVELESRREGTDLIIVVRDTGIGISEDHLPHIFDRFYRVDASHQSEGTGIGLSLTKELAELHHGTIALSSTVGKGTTATVRIPISGYAESEIARASQPAEGKRTHDAREAPLSEALPSMNIVEKPMVLVVEDNDDARAYLRSRLEPEFEVTEAPTGTRAIERAQERIPDIVVSDVMMPEMNGYELCRQLKSDVRTSHIPVILLTALADRTDRIEGLETGADDFLVKPFDAQELLVRIRNLITNRKSIQERFSFAIPWKIEETLSGSLDDVFLRKAMAVVADHLGDERFSVEQFATEIFLGRAQLHRKLKALTNLSSTDFIRHFRLQRAKELLEERAGTIAEIAERVGFVNHSYFAKSFKEQFGILPSEAHKAL